MKENSQEKLKCGFELGPIRPPSEAGSILIRLTRNCPWNKCAFCHSYKEQKFSIRSIDEIKSDIDSIHLIAKKITDKTNSNLSNEDSLRQIALETNIEESYIQQVAYWLYYGTESLFLQDADSLVMKTDLVVEILNYIKEKFPSIKRITTYARSKTISKKSQDELERLKNAGLNRIHIGFESGSDKALEVIKKGVTSEEHILAGKKAIAAGFELSEYFMPGAGGKEYTKENAIESARVLNEINPTFIRIRSVVPLPNTPLFDLLQEKIWTPLTEEEKVYEIKTFIEHLEGISSVVKSDHVMNLLEDVQGSLPKDKQNILDLIDKFLGMDINDKESFIIGRRIGRYRSLSDFSPNSEIEKIKEQIKNNYNSLDEGILEILWNYI